jgi:hypothetical protein
VSSLRIRLIIHERLVRVTAGEDTRGDIDHPTSWLGAV